MKHTDFLVLAVLTEGPNHGYALAQAIAERTDRRTVVRPGDLYRVLYRMANAGLIEPSDGETSGDDDSRRAYYRITPEGRRVARDEARLLRGVCDGVLRRRGMRAGRSS